MSQGPDPSGSSAEAVAAHMVELAPHPTCLLSGDGRVVAVSPAMAERLGVERRELLGRRIHDVVADGAAAVDRVLATWRGSGGWRPGPLHAPGGVATVELHCRGARLRGTDLLLVELGEHERAVADFVSLSRDVELANLRRMEARLQDSLAELEALNQRLELANAELDRYASMVSHDIRTPFNAIARFTAMLVEDHGEGLPDAAQQMIGAIGRLAARGEEVTEALLALARTGEAELVLSGTDSSAVAARVCRDLEPQIAEAGAEVVVGELPPTAAQAVHVERVLTNLISNALKYRAAQRSPRITVEGRHETDIVRFTVTDNGVGIPEQERERIFEPLVRGQAGTQVPGTGVGLATCRKIVEAYGGSIGVVERPGDGAALEFTLPAADPQEAVALG